MFVYPIYLYREKSAHDSLTPTRSNLGTVIFWMSNSEIFHEQAMNKHRDPKCLNVHEHTNKPSKCSLLIQFRQLILQHFFNFCDSLCKEQKQINTPNKLHSFFFKYFRGFSVWCRILNAFSLMLMVVNSSMNIVFYGLFNNQFRKVAK